MTMEFLCPKCGGRYYSRDIGAFGQPLPTIRCNGQSSSGPATCDWRGEWTQEVINKGTNKLIDAIFNGDESDTEE